MSDFLLAIAIQWQATLWAASMVGASLAATANRPIWASCRGVGFRRRRLGDRLAGPMAENPVADFAAELLKGRIECEPDHAATYAPARESQWDGLGLEQI